MWLEKVDKPVILFDGACNLCAASVQFVIQHDPQAKFRFTSLQSERGKRLLEQHHLPIDQLDTFVLVDGNFCYTRSTAAFHVVRKLGGYWLLLYPLILVPKIVRDSVYEIIAKNRYRWFGKRQECILPTEDIKSRFLS